MEDMVKDYGNISRLTDTRDSGFDFETKSAYIEMKVTVPVTDGTDTCIWRGFHQAVKQMVGLSNNFVVREKSKRIILLAICQHGTSHIQAMANGKTREELAKAVSRGIELWGAETKTEEDGISLLEYWNYTDKILKS